MNYYLKMLIYTTIVIFLLTCKKPAPTLTEKTVSKESPYAVVVLVMGNSRIQHFDSTEEKAAIGSYFRTGDKIITGSKTRVDVQIGESSIIRISSETNIEFTKLLKAAEGNLNTRLSITEGKVFIKVPKSLKSDSFQIAGPSFMAGVRGTEFIVDMENENWVTVKVLEGSVVLRPRVKSIENLSLDELEKSKSAREVNKVVESSEIIIDKSFQLTVPSKEELLVKDKLDDKDVSETINAVEKFKVKPENAQFSKQEEQELKTLLMEKSDVIKEMTELNEELTSGKVDEKRAEELESKRSILENQILKKQDSEKGKFNESIVVAPRKLPSKRAIIKYYDRIEKLLLTRNRVEIGAIISEEDGMMILHTENGIKRIPKEEVVEVIYEFQKRSKF